MKNPVQTSRAHVALALTSLAAVALVFVLDLGRALPGAVHEVHARAPELAGGQRCELCHGAAGQSMAEACGACHAGVLADIAAGSGLHGALAGDPLDCGNCHVEHHGKDVALAGRRSFAEAGFGEREAFDHAPLGFVIEGRPQELGCAHCHPNADTALLPEGQSRFGGLAPACTPCHADVHAGRIARGCAECHGQELPFGMLAGFSHRTFESTSAHAIPDCLACHPSSSAHAVEALADLPEAPERGCAECHESPHAADFLAGAAVLAELAQADVCTACHAEAHGSFAEHPDAMPPALHAASGFELTLPHAALACERCHRSAQGDTIETRFDDPPRSAEDCGACHGDPHRSEFARGPFATDACLDCHERHAFQPSTFGPDQHERAAFPLEGSHRAVACTRCHAATARPRFQEEGVDDGPRDFRAAPRSCSGCHADAHRGALTDALATPALEPAIDSGHEGCARCHVPTLFAEVREDAFDHARSTGFALEGAHARARCAACHPPSSESDEFGRRFGFATSERPAEECAGCHADVHAGRFERAELPAERDGRPGCARCHTVQSFAAVAPEDFDHELWTGYPLAGGHLGLACESCHATSTQADALGRRFGRAAGSACDDCHADPHAGQFAVAGDTDCARCHEPAGDLVFDHQRDSRFALDGTHAALACSACHVPWKLASGVEAVRYKPLGTACADCHTPGSVPVPEDGG